METIKALDKGYIIGSPLLSKRGTWNTNFAPVMELSLGSCSQPPKDSSSTMLRGRGGAGTLGKILTSWGIFPIVPMRATHSGRTGQGIVGTR
jgi:hypothetical protein